MRRALGACLFLISSVGCATGETASLDPSEGGSYSAPAMSDAEQRELQEAVHAQSEYVGPAARVPTAAPVVAPDANGPPATTQSAPRLVVYTATLRVIVASTADALANVQRIAEEAGGFLQESAAQSITVRVPAPAFEATIAKLDRLGEVVDRAVKATDVSEQMLDLDVRLDNARRTRDRLAAHLAKSEKMEDTIKLEAELARVTTELEKLEASRRLLASQIAMSTIRVELNPARPQTARGGAVNSPFRWIDQLGYGLAGVAESMPRQPVFLGGAPKFDPPPGFVRYYSAKDIVEAMDADGLRIRVQRKANFDRAPLEFWHKLARKSLVEGRSLSLTSDGHLAAGNDWSGFGGTREVGRETYEYLLVLTTTKDHVYLFEAWGPARAWDQKRDAVLKSATSLKR